MFYMTCTTMVISQVYWSCMTKAFKLIKNVRISSNFKFCRLVTEYYLNLLYVNLHSLMVVKTDLPSRRTHFSWTKDWRQQSPWGEPTYGGWLPSQLFRTDKCQWIWIRSLGQKPERTIIIMQQEQWRWLLGDDCF